MKDHAEAVLSVLTGAAGPSALITGARSQANA